MAGAAHSFEKAKSYALRLLKVRLRSENELRRRMKRKGFEGERVDCVCHWLKGLGMVDDEAFTHAWVKSRLNRAYGLNRIRFELKEKGVSAALAERVCHEASERYSESKVIEELLERRLRQVKGLPVEKAQRRLCGYLVRRGFSNALARRHVYARIPFGKQD